MLVLTVSMYRGHLKISNSGAKMNAIAEAVFSLVKNKQSESHVSGCKEAKESFLIGLCMCWMMFTSLCNSPDLHPIFFFIMK